MGKGKLLRLLLDELHDCVKLSWSNMKSVSLCTVVIQ